jgi:hypothetical protein
MLASPRYAAAASVVLAVSLGFSAMLYRENRSLREDAFPETSLITRLVALDAVRGDNVVEIAAPEDDELMVLLLDAPLAAYDTYRAALTRRDGDRSEEVWNRDDLAPQLGGSITIGVPGRILRPGTYEAVVGGRMNEWPADRFDEISRIRLTVLPRD